MANNFLFSDIFSFTKISLERNSLKFSEMKVLWSLSIFSMKTARIMYLSLLIILSQRSMYYLEKFVLSVKNVLVLELYCVFRHLSQLNQLEQRHSSSLQIMIELGHFFCKKRKWKWWQQAGNRKWLPGYLWRQAPPLQPINYPFP